MLSCLLAVHTRYKVVDDSSMLQGPPAYPKEGRELDQVAYATNAQSVHSHPCKKKSDVNRDERKAASKGSHAISDPLSS